MSGADHASFSPSRSRSATSSCTITPRDLVRDFHRTCVGFSVEVFFGRWESALFGSSVSAQEVVTDEHRFGVQISCEAPGLRRQVGSVDRLDVACDDPAVLSDHPVALEAELLVGGQRPVVQEPGWNGACRLRVPLDDSTPELTDQPGARPRWQLRRHLGDDDPSPRSSRRFASQAGTSTNDRRQRGS